MGEMKRALSAHEGREENQAFPSSCTGQGPSLGRQAEMAAQITCLVRRQQERSHRTQPLVNRKSEGRAGPPSQEPGLGTGPATKEGNRASSIAKWG